MAARTARRICVTCQRAWTSADACDALVPGSGAVDSGCGSWGRALCWGAAPAATCVCSAAPLTESSSE